MTDDHDRCEWMNVSSGTDSPGLSWTKSRQHACVRHSSFILSVDCTRLFIYSLFFICIYR